MVHFCPLYADNSTGGSSMGSEYIRMLDGNDAWEEQHGSARKQETEKVRGLGRIRNICDLAGRGEWVKHVERVF